MAAVLYAAGCGGEETPETSEKAQPRAEMLPTGRTAGPLPPGLSQSVGIRVGGGPEGPVDCPATSTPHISFARGVATGTTKIGSAVVVCFTGFDVRRPLSIDITGPGRVTRRLLGSRYVEDRVFEDPGTANRAYQFWMATLPPIEPGRYVVEATQAGARASGEFRLLRTAVQELWVVPATNDGFSLFAHPDVRPGQPIRIVLTGFPPDRNVRIHFYGGRVSTTDRYLTTMTVRTDARGYGFMRIPTSTRHRGFQYCAVPERAVLHQIGLGEMAERSWCRDRWFTVGDADRG